RHLPVTDEDNVLPWQKVRQPDMFAAGLQLWDVCRAIPRAAMQHVEPPRPAPITSGQGKELALLAPRPRWVVTRLQARSPCTRRLVRTQPGKGHRHGVSMQT